MTLHRMYLIAAILCGTSAVQADESPLDSSWYLGGAIGAMKYRQAGLEDYGLDDYRLILGRQLNRVFAVELHAGTGSDDTQPIFGTPVTLSLDNYVAGFLKAQMTFTSVDWQNNRVRVYGMLGGTRIETTSSDPVTTRSGAQTSLAAAAGVEVFVDNIGFQLGYTRYVDESYNGSDYTLDSMHLGILYYFTDMFDK